MPFETHKEVFTLRGSETEEIMRKIFNIPPEVLERLRNIAQLVGRDWRMKVELGIPGEGSFFYEDEKRIQLDPLHLRTEEGSRQGEFIVAHEGGHRAITRGPQAIGLRKEKAMEFYGKLGFDFGANALEDPADNNWWMRQYDGLEDTVGTIYDKMFQEDGAVLGTPPIQKMIARLGYVPKFVHFGSELIRLWHTGHFSENIPEEVRQALERVKSSAQNYFQDIPSDHSEESEVIEKARSRFATYLTQVWPEMEQLVEDDLKDETLRKMFEENKTSLDELSSKLREELKTKIEEAMAHAKDSAETEAVKLQKEVQELNKEAEKIQGQLTERTGDEKNIGEEIVLQLRKSAEEKEKKAEEVLGNASESQPLPVRDLSPELRKALERIFQKLPAKEKERLTADARKELETLEDALNETIEGKLVPKKPENHEERHTREERELVSGNEDARKRKQQETEAAEIAKALEQDKSVYDLARERAEPLLRVFVQGIQKIFLKKRHPRWRSGFPSGGRVDLRKAMQFEARPETYNELWERKTIPEKYDFKFTFLVDLSGSMRGEKIERTFEGIILLAEGFFQCGIDIEILGFQNELIEFKSFDERMSDVVRSRMSGMIDEVYDKNPGGHNQSSWNDDGYALRRAVDRLKQRVGKEKFLVILSDGLPYPSQVHAGPEWDLKKIIQSIKEERAVRLVGIGLGTGTEHVKIYYPHSIVCLRVKDFSKEIVRLFEDILKNPHKY